MSSNDKESKLVDFLALVYMRVPWGKMQMGKNVWDVFNHRVRAASRKGTMQAFASKLCNYFGIQSLPPEAVLILDDLIPDQEKVLNLLYMEHIPICMRAVIKAKEIREAKKEKEKQQKKEEKDGKKLQNSLWSV